jgi:hypothetical protein
MYWALAFDFSSNKPRNALAADAGSWAVTWSWRMQQKKNRIFFIAMKITKSNVVKQLGPGFIG